MKKLMIAIAAVAIGVVANAASYTWTSTGIYNGAGATSASLAYLPEGTTAYMLFTTYSQTDLLADYVTAKGNKTTFIDTYLTSSKVVGTGTVNDSGKIGGATGSASVTTDMTAYYVIVMDDKLFISTTATAEYSSLPGGTDVAFKSTVAPSKALPTDAATGTGAAGWYAVPEPTSGLLMLLGMAGLALRRKRA